MINFYSLIPQDKKAKYRNPSFQKHGIEVPFRMLVCGNSGSMKTNFVVNLIKIMDNTFESISVVTKNGDEPLYNMLKAKLPQDEFHMYEGIEEIPPLDSFDPKYQHLAIFDDLVLEKKQACIEDYFIRCRKLGISCVYIAQSYFRTPKTIRINCSYIVLKKLSSTRDLTAVMSDFSLGGIDKKELLDMYRHATQRPEDALIIDTNKSQFRRNFLDIYK